MGDRHEVPARAFTAITRIEASSITDGSILVPVVLAGLAETNLRVSADDSLDAARSRVEARLAAHADVDDPALELVGAVMASMRDMPPDARVEQLAARHYVAPRTLQRLFQRYVGVSPRWALKRLRIHQAVAQLAAGQQRPWTQLALELGYYDHAHFIRDFRLVTERSPAEYVREALAARSAPPGDVRAGPS